ncbi:DUF4150 domain-containing protein [Yoonia sp. R2331]|uniref:DUF4150 domain-containing protein n=1 Tax=Yoonia sp. R2331 TaxID=3237238 RepID=UPI0034E58143
MIPTVVVNKLTVVHKKSDGIAICGPPDVCKTPSPGGPVPIPYPNIALSKHLAKGTKTVKADGVPIALKTSEFSTSTGDEGGTAGGGVVSGKIKGKAKFINYSFDVMAEGKNVARLSDPMTMNGNSPNTTNPAELQGNMTGLGDIEDILCRIFCWCDAGNDGDDFVEFYPEGSI